MLIIVQQKTIYVDHSSSILLFCNAYRTSMTLRRVFSLRFFFLHSIIRLPYEQHVIVNPINENRFVTEKNRTSNDYINIINTIENVNWREEEEKTDLV